MTKDDRGTSGLTVPIAERRAAERVKAPERNRVTPTGDIVAIPLRGAWTGNRGILHSGRQNRPLPRRATCGSPAPWEFRGRYHPDQWLPRHYTFLFFYDEAVSLAAGHRPCGGVPPRRLPRLPAAPGPRGSGVPLPSAKEMNRQLHGERIVRATRRRRTHEMPWAGPARRHLRPGRRRGRPFIIGDRLVPVDATRGTGRPAPGPGAGPPRSSPRRRPSPRCGPGRRSTTPRAAPGQRMLARDGDDRARARQARDFNCFSRSSMTRKSSAIRLSSCWN